MTETSAREKRVFSLLEPSALRRTVVCHSLRDVSNRDSLQCVFVYVCIARLTKVLLALQWVSC